MPTNDKIASAQQAVPFTGADDADAEFLLHLTNFLTADTAAGG